MSRQDIYDAYNDEVSGVEEDFADGRITAGQRREYLDNLYNNLRLDLEETGNDDGDYDE